MKCWQVAGVNSKLYFIDVLIVDFYEIWKLDFELMNLILLFNARGVFRLTNFDEIFIDYRWLFRLFWSSCYAIVFDEIWNVDKL